METESLILLIILMLMFSAFFSGVEIAFISANRLRLELLKNQKGITSRILTGFSENSNSFLGMTLLGNNVALVVLGLSATKLLEEPLAGLFSNWFGAGDYSFLSMIIQTIFTTVLVLIFGEFIPKALFQINSARILQILAIPLKLLYWVMWLPVMVIMLITRLILKGLFKIDTKYEKQVFSRVDLEEFVEHFINIEEQEDNDLNTDIFQKAISFNKIKIRECMVPRMEISAIEINESIESLRSLILDSKHSKVLVYEDNIDNIQGYVHHFDLLSNPKTIKEILFPINVIPETMGARNLLNLFIEEHKSIAWVVDEFGGTAGIVTLEDILEEIFGEIHDEYDSEDFIDRQLSENEFIFSGRLEVDHINETYGLHLPEGEYETLAGLIFAHHENIPEPQELITIGPFEFKIINVSDRRIETVKLKVLNESD